MVMEFEYDAVSTKKSCEKNIVKIILGKKIASLISSEECIAAS